MINKELKWEKEAFEKWHKQNNILVEKIHELYKRKLDTNLTDEEIARINAEINKLTQDMESVEHPYEP